MGSWQLIQLIGLIQRPEYSTGFVVLTSKIFRIVQNMTRNVALDLNFGFWELSNFGEIFYDQIHLSFTIPTSVSCE